MSSKQKLVVLGVLIVVVCSCLTCLGIRGGGRSAPPPTKGPEPTSTAMATQVPVPTATAMSTPTMTSTPIATATPSPTATSSPTAVPTMTSTPTATETPTIVLPTAIETAVPAPAVDPCKYIGNSNTMKFHYARCVSVGQMKGEHKVCFATREEAIGRGYVPCKKCHP